MFTPKEAAQRIYDILEKYHFYWLEPEEILENSDTNQAIEFYGKSYGDPYEESIYDVFTTDEIADLKECARVLKYQLALEVFYD